MSDLSSKNYKKHQIYIYVKNINKIFMYVLIFVFFSYCNNFHLLLGWAYYLSTSPPCNLKLSSFGSLDDGVSLDDVGLLKCLFIAFFRYAILFIC
jgi:hypothetical protein